MVKRAYENLPVEVWRFRGRLGRSTHSLCLFHSELDEGRPILAALRELENGAAPARLTLTFAKNARSGAVEKLTLQYVAESVELKVLQVTWDPPSAAIRFTKPGLLVLINATAKWLEGAEDFGVDAGNSYFDEKELGPLDRDSDEIWFWGPTYFAP